MTNLRAGDTVTLRGIVSSSDNDHAVSIMIPQLTSDGEYAERHAEITVLAASVSILERSFHVGDIVVYQGSEMAIHSQPESGVFMLHDATKSGASAYALADAELISHADDKAAPVAPAAFPGVESHTEIAASADIVEEAMIHQPVGQDVIDEPVTASEPAVPTDLEDGSRQAVIVSEGTATLQKEELTPAAVSVSFANDHVTVGDQMAEALQKALSSVEGVGASIILTPPELDQDEEAPALTSDLIVRRSERRPSLLDLGEKTAIEPIGYESSDDELLLTPDQSVKD